MKAICGFFRLDGAPASVAHLRALRGALVYNPARQTAQFDGDATGPVALGSAAWSAHAIASLEPQIYRHAESGCIAVVDARLDERAALAARLGLSNEVAGANQAELILHAWLHWGEQCPEHLYGDFAFAVWDPREQRLFCARDIMGVRPLYVHHQPGKLFAFASRASALLALPDVPTDLNEGRITDFLVTQLEGIDKTSTFFSAVQRLPPAHCVVTQPERSWQRCYWRLQPGLIQLPTTDAQWADALTDVLERAVRHHLDGEARVGCMLSGGLDSSSLAVIAADQLAAAGKAPLPTFSSVDDDPACAETLAIRAMLERPGFAPTLIDPAAIDAMREALAEAAAESEEPFDGSMVLLHAQYLAASRTGVDAVIDGIDGDTLFSDGSGLIRQLQRLQWGAAWTNIRGLQRIYPNFAAWRYVLMLSRGAFIPDGLRRLRGDRLPAQTRDAIQSTLIAPDFAARIDLPSRLRRLNQWHSPATPRDVASQAAQSLAHPYPICGMERYHRVAAWHGVDPRHPFTDRKVLELCVNLPDAQRLSDGWSKAALRHAMRGRLPDPVCWRTGKQHLGWRLVERVLLNKPEAVRQRVAEYRDALAPYVDPTKLDGALQRWQQPGQRAAKSAVFEALCLGHWLTHQAMFGPSRGATHRDQGHPLSAEARSTSAA